MWRLLRLFAFSLCTQAAVGQLEYRVLEFRQIKADGSVNTRPSGEDGLNAAVSLQAEGAKGGAEDAGLALVSLQGDRGVTAQDYDFLGGRELQATECEVTVMIMGVVADEGASIVLTITVRIGTTNASLTNGLVVVDADGQGKATFTIDINLVNADGDGFCLTCIVEITAGDCRENCTNYDQDASNNAITYVVTKIFGDPHMVGMLGQTFDWSGEDKGWYCLVSDGPDFQLNARVTAPMPEEFPDRQLVTAVSILSAGGHSLVIEVKDPYITDTEGCADDSPVPCLANGALRVIVDGEEISGLQAPIEATELPGGRLVSSANLPVECRPFGGDRIWAAQHAATADGRRSLRARERDFDQWILDESNMAAPTWCAKFLEEKGLPGLLAVQSNHAIFRIVTPTTSLRINIGVNYQDLVISEDGDTVLVPELEFWQGNVGVERNEFSDTVSGMLGETSRLILDKHGLPVMEGLGAIRGTPESYRMDGPYGVELD